jgi:hypothetical protein
MGMDDFFKDRQIPIDNIQEGQTSPNQEGQQIWDYGDNESNFRDLSITQVDTAIIQEFQNKGAVFIDGKQVPIIIGGSEKWNLASRTYLYDKETMTLRLPVISIKMGDVTLDRKRWTPKTRFGATDLVFKTIVKEDGEVREIRVLSVSPPIPITKTYEVIVWVGFMEDLSTIQSHFMNHFSYNSVYYEDFFFTTEMNDSMSVQDNFEEYGAEDRLIRGTLNLTVNAYLLDSKTSYTVQNIIKSVKIGTAISEKVIFQKSKEYQWRSPYELRHKKI